MRRSIAMCADWAPPRIRPNPETFMLDVAFVALGLAWFAIFFGFAAFCDRL